MSGEDQAGIPLGGVEERDIHRYSTENVLRQIASAEPRLGFYEVLFYAVEGRPSREKTSEIGKFFYYPSGGTLRDAEMNIIFYEPRLDRYRVTRKNVHGESPDE